MSCKLSHVALFVALSGAVFGQLTDDQGTILKKKIESGETKLEWATKLGYLPAVLKEFNIDPESQVLVFSKTSFQSPKIDPKHPRAIFFNDTTTVGSVQGSDVLELAALGAKDGIGFYTMEARKSEPLKIARQGEACLSCHAPVNLGIGGLVVNSVYPNREGTPLFLGVGTFAQTIDHRTPLEDRWGGWYVTGTHGKVNHMGNAVAPDPLHPGDLETVNTQNLTGLSSKFDTSNFLQPTSDIVALMTLEHQVTMMNLIARLAAYTNLSRGDYATNEKRFNTLIEDMLAYMLFVDETKLKSPVKGVSGFSKNFEARGPKDPQGRSLRDYDLQKRMFKYPLTYMVYAEPFDQLPAKAKERLLKRLHEVLTGVDKSERFSKIAAVDKKNILEILRATKPNLPDYWR